MMAATEEPSKHTVEDFALAPSHVPEDTVDLIHLVRVIAAEASSVIPGQSGSVQAIAERTGLSVARVREVLTHPDYRALLHQSLRDRAISHMHAGVDTMHELIQDPEQKPLVKVQAMRALTAAYTAVSGAEQPHRQDVGKAAFESIIKVIAERKKALDVSQKLNRITIDPEHEASRNEADRQEG